MPPAMHLHAHCHVVTPCNAPRVSMMSSGYRLHQRSQAQNAQALSSCSRQACPSLHARKTGCRSARASVQIMARRGGGNSKLDAGDGFEERVVQVRRVTKVVKGGKQLSFRCSHLHTVISIRKPCTQVVRSNATPSSLQKAVAIIAFIRFIYVPSYSIQAVRTLALAWHAHMQPACTCRLKLVL